jgi:hypothetical protein
VNPREKICTKGVVSSALSTGDSPRATRSSIPRYVFVTVATYSGFFLRPSTLRQPMPAAAMAGK